MCCASLISVKMENLTKRRALKLTTQSGILCEVAVQIEYQLLSCWTNFDLTVVSAKPPANTKNDSYKCLSFIITNCELE